jgi:hypothetical protein
MINKPFFPIRKPVLAGLMALAAACGGAAQAADLTMFRSPSCGCCLAWIEHIRGHWKAAGIKGEVKSIDNPAMGAMKKRAGVPEDLFSCHTTLVDGYVIEGHVPAADIARLIKDRPEGVRGLAVAGMPMGSPGMEHGSHRDAFKVVAFGPKGRSIYASYAARH